jgi:hypothetical protein
MLNEEQIQRQIAAAKKENMLEGIEQEAMHERAKAREIAQEKKKAAGQAKADQLKAQMELETEALNSAKGNEEEINRIKAEGVAERAKIENEHMMASEQIAINANNKLIEIEQDRIAAVEQAEEESRKKKEQAEKDSLQKRLAMAQEYVNAASSIANDLSAIWKNNIDYQLDEDLKANDKALKSDEERAAKEKELLIKAAYAKYEADLFAWSANSTMAAAQAAMGVLRGLAEGGVPMAIAAGVVGALQVAAVISARPKPPRFHEGGVVSGRLGQEVPAVLMSGETVTTSKQFQSAMEAFANVAVMKNGGQPAMSVKVYNNAANDVSVSHQITPEGLEFTVTQIVNKSFGNGSLSTGLIAEDAYRRGASFG